MQGFSARNLKYMRAFAEAWPEEAIVQLLVAQLPWGVRLLEKVESVAERTWYIEQAVQNGWSRNVLVLQIESGLCRRQGRAITNFTPPPNPTSPSSFQKTPFNFDFLTVVLEARERDVEHGLIQHPQKFLLELSVGFAFVGS